MLKLLFLIALVGQLAVARRHPRRALALDLALSLLRARRARRALARIG